MGTVYEKHPVGLCNKVGCLWCGVKDPFPGWGTLKKEPEMSTEDPKNADRVYGHGIAPCDIPNCSRCDPAGALTQLQKKKGVMKAMTEKASEPNRFDPYEALDKLEGGIEDIRNFYPDLDPRCEEISERLNALRAYITGMER